MAVKKFEELVAWQKVQDLSVKIYSHFSNIKDFSFRDQIQRASVSISNNIAEGFDRSSNKDFSRFLYMSLGSASEVKSMLYLASRLKLIDGNEFSKLLDSTNEVSKIIRGLIKSLST